MNSEITRKNDEIELMELFIVLWKRKIFIVSGVLLSLAVTLLICLNLPRIYQVAMKIRPGDTKIEAEHGLETENGLIILSKLEDECILEEEYKRRLYIKRNIDGNVYDQDVLKQLSTMTIKGMAIKQMSNDINFTVSIQENSCIIEVKLDTPDVELGVHILQILYSLLEKEDNLITNGILEKYDQRIRLAKIELEENQALKKLELYRLANINQRKAYFDEMIVVTKKSSEVLVAQQQKVLQLSIRKKENSIDDLLYTNTIQQKSRMLYNLITDREELFEAELILKNKLIELDRKQKRIKESILKTEALKNELRSMVLLTQPIQGKHPIKPKNKRIVFLSGMVSLFLMIVVAFLLEYVANYKAAHRENSRD